ncbi:MAG TPA: hypothetical protein VLF20_00350, partial [Patescibacteria group bacterium]|nr:hypothetical protein [Patescibacteria group bacterium]
MKYAKIIFLLGLFILTIGDLYRFTTKYITFAEQTYLFPETKVLSFLQNQGGPFRVMSTDSRVFPPNFSAMYHIQTPDGYDPLFTERYAEFAAAISRGKPDINPPFGFNRIITVQNSESFFIDLLNIRYLLSLRELDSEHFKKIMSEGETIVYENTNVLPRTFFVNEVRQASGKQDTIEKLFSLERQLHEKAVVEGMEKKTAEALVNKQSSSVVITSYTSNRVVLETENIGEKFLVLSDAYYPTWHVNICNEEESECKGTTIYVTNYAFRGVIVPAGKHHVIFENRLL